MTDKTSKITIHGVDHSTSKEDEIAYLDQFLKNVGKGSYLSLFFTDNLVSWLKGKIRDDFTPDLFGVYQVTLHEATEAEARYSREHELSNALNKKVTDMIGLIYDLQKRIDQLVNTGIQQAGSVLEANERANDERRQAQVAADQFGFEREQLRRTINDLKAKLYDVEHAEGSL